MNDGRASAQAVSVNLGVVIELTVFAKPETGPDVVVFALASFPLYPQLAVQRGPVTFRADALVASDIRLDLIIVLQTVASTVLRVCHVAVA